jgi:hypothetical protein
MSHVGVEDRERFLSIVWQTDESFLHRQEGTLTVRARNASGDETVWV